MAARLSRYTAENQYGMVGYGAGPASTVAAPGPADAAAGITGGMSPAPPPPNGSATLILPGRIMDDPAFWLVATAGAVIALAAYSAGPTPR